MIRNCSILLIIIVLLIVPVSTSPRAFAAPLVMVSPTCGPSSGFNIVVDANGFAPNTNVNWKIIDSHNGIPQYGYFQTNSTGGFNDVTFADDLKADNYKMAFGTDSNNDNRFDAGAPIVFSNLTIPCSSFQEPSSPPVTGGSFDTNSNNVQDSTQKFNVQIILDDAINERYQVRVTVYGVHTLNKPTLDKPGIPIYDSQCNGGCSIDAGVWSFTDWKVNDGDQIKACATDTQTGNQYCGYGNADKSHINTIHIPISANSQRHQQPNQGGSGINWNEACQKLQRWLVHDCGDFFTTSGGLDALGIKTRNCLLGGALIASVGILSDHDPLDIIRNLERLSGERGCDGIVKWDILRNDVSAASEFLKVLKLINGII